MAILSKEELTEKAREGYTFRFGEYFNDAFSIWKQNIGGFALFTLVYVAILAIGSFIPFVGSFAVGLVLAPALTAGYYIVTQKIRDGEPTEFGDFFKGFNYLRDLFLAALIMNVIYIVLFGIMVSIIGITSVVPAVMSGDPERIAEIIMEKIFRPSSLITMLVFFVPMIYLGVAWLWTNNLIVFHKLSFWDAMETSRKLITKNWGWVLLFSIVMGFLGSLGAIAFGIGIVLTLPWISTGMQSAFADVTELDHTNGALVQDDLVL